MNFKKAISAIITILALFFFTNVLSAQKDDPLDPEDMSSKQQSDTIKKNNLILSQKIAQIYRLFKAYHTLYDYYKPGKSKDPNDPNERWRQITRTPRQTYIRYIHKDPGNPKSEVIGWRLTQYDFVYPEGKTGVTDPCGSRSKAVEMYFQGGNLTKVVSILEEHDFLNQTSKKDIITDENPATNAKSLKYVSDGKGGEKVEKIDDIKFQHVYSHGATYISPLWRMKLEVSKPYRLIFKRDFYLKHLIHFENLFRLTDEYQQYKRDDKDYFVVKDLEETLDY
jgi:hypothetical protein